MLSWRHSAGKYKWQNPFIVKSEPIKINHKSHLETLITASTKKVLADFFIYIKSIDSILPERLRLPFQTLSLMEYRYGESSGNYIWMDSLGQIISVEKCDKSEIVINCINITFEYYKMVVLLE